jgi:hypothetical protein
MIFLDLLRLRIKIKMFLKHEINKFYFVSGKGTRSFVVIISLRQGECRGRAEASYFWRKKAACELFIITLPYKVGLYIHIPSKVAT